MVLVAQVENPCFRPTLKAESGQKYLQAWENHYSELKTNLCAVWEAQLDCLLTFFLPGESHLKRVAVKIVIFNNEEQQYIVMEFRKVQMYFL